VWNIASTMRQCMALDPADLRESGLKRTETCQYGPVGQAKRLRPRYWPEAFRCAARSVRFDRAAVLLRFAIDPVRDRWLLVLGLLRPAMPLTRLAYQLASPRGEESKSAIRAPSSRRRLITSSAR
jgi:hypothetical protein